MFHVVKGFLRCVRPKWRHRVGIFIPEELTQRGNTKLKMMNETQIELCKANEFGYVPNELRGWPGLQKSVL